MIGTALGLLTGVGLVLIASPWLWPRTGERRARPRSALVIRARERLTQAGLPRLPLAAFVAASALLGLLGGGVVLAALGVLPLALAAAVALGSAPAAVVRRRANTRLRATRTMWPDAVDHLLAGVRAGLSLPDAVLALATAGPSALRPDFARFAVDLRASGSFGLALDELKARLADPVADRLAETLRMARDVGGTELPAILRELSAALRQQESVRAEVEARQSWVRNAARLGVAAPWAVLVLLSTRPEAAEAYDSPAGAVLVLVGLAVSVLAYRLMVRIGRLPSERRWA